MGTRCLTVFTDEYGKEICVLYRQFDGYPEGHGAELVDFLKGTTIVNGISLDADESKIFNGMNCLTASVVAFFKKERVRGFYLYPAETRDYWEDYIYFVTGKVGEQPSIVMKDYNGKETKLL